MPASQNEVVANFAAGSVAVVTTAETVIATTQPLSTPTANGRVLVEFAGEFSPGAATTSVTLRVRRDGVAGTVVYTGNALGWGAATRQQFALAALDQGLADVAGQVWVLTATQAAATGNGAATNMASKLTTAV